MSTLIRTPIPMPLVYARVPFLILILLSLASPVQGEQLWLSNSELTPQATALIRLLQDAKVYGLEPADYVVDEVAPPFETEAVRNRTNASITAAATQFISDLHFGRVDARAAGFHFSGPARQFDVQQSVRQLSKSSDVQGTLRMFQPRARPYWLLFDALAQYRQLSQAPELIRLPPLPRPKVNVGTVYTGAPALRRLLRAFGDLSEGVGDSDAMIFGPTLAAAVKNFQMRNGIAADGVLGRQTYAELVTPLSVRVRQLELALERWRWTNVSERPDIVVNVPQFMLYALPKQNDVEGEVLEMPVVVGRSSGNHQTPIFSAQLKRVIFQPYWDVPYSITLKELLPIIRKDSHYLEEHDMEIVDGDQDESPLLPNTPESIAALAAGKARLRQKPGPQNALGPVKFVLPNAYNVYLHGTPERALFEKARRDFSHGCVRVSDPAALAEYVLQNAPEPWDMDRIQNAMCGTQQIRVDLKTPLLVMFFYSTAAATQSQGALFAPDVYGQDAKLEALLRERAHQRANSSR